jgi:hypothetical protein
VDIPNKKFDLARVVPQHHGNGSALPSEKRVLISLQLPNFCAAFARFLPYILIRLIVALTRLSSTCV